MVKIQCFSFFAAAARRRPVVPIIIGGLKTSAMPAPRGLRLALLAALAAPCLPAALLPCDSSRVLVRTLAPGAPALAAPAGLSASRSGILWVADADNNAIRALDLNSTRWLTGMWAMAPLPPAGYAEGPLNTTARFSAPQGVVADACSARVFVADSGSAVVRVLQPYASNVTTRLLAGAVGASATVDGVGSSAQFERPLGLALSPSCAVLYVTDNAQHTVRAIVVASRVVYTLAGMAGAGDSRDGVGAAARFYQPMQLGIDSFGSLLVTGNFVRRRMALRVGLTLH